MALTQVWELGGTTDTVIDATDYIQFSDGTFDNPITVGSYNAGTHVRSSGGANDSSANTPNNNEYVDATHVKINGGASALLSTITDAQCALEITVGYDTNITVTDITIFAYDGTTEATAPTNLDVYLAEGGVGTWVNADGSASAADIADSSTPATSHVFYVAMSVSPSAVGTQSANKVKFSFTYQ